MPAGLDMLPVPVAEGEVLEGDGDVAVVLEGAHEVGLLRVLEVDGDLENGDVLPVNGGVMLRTFAEDHHAGIGPAGDDERVVTARDVP